MTRTLDLSGKSFGSLLVLKKCVGNTKQGKTRWLVKCICGETKEVVGASLISGLTLSCGCHSRRMARLHVKNIEGNRFGKLLVISRVSSSNNDHHVHWQCLCDCRTFCIVSGKNLRTGHTTSCGCFRKVANLTHGLTGTRQIKRVYEKRRREKEQGLDSQWTYLMELALQTMFPNCINCGSADQMNTDHVYPLSAGYGLVPGNAVRLCKSCNSKKHAKMPEQLSSEFKNNVLESAEKFRLAWSGGF